MIGSSVFGGLVFWISDWMFFNAFDVLIKYLKVNRHHNPTASSISRSLKDTRVHFKRSQSLRENKLTKFRKPCTWALLQTIDSTREMTYLGSLPLNCIPMWFFHKDTLCKITIEEGIGNIELMKIPPLINRHRENNMYRVEAYHKAEGLLIVHHVGQGEPTSN